MLSRGRHYWTQRGQGLQAGGRAVGLVSHIRFTWPSSRPRSPTEPIRDERPDSHIQPPTASLSVALFTYEIPSTVPSHRPVYSPCLKCRVPVSQGGSPVLSMSCWCKTAILLTLVSLSLSLSLPLSYSLSIWPGTGLRGQKRQSVVRVGG